MIKILLADADPARAFAIERSLCDASVMRVPLGSRVGEAAAANPPDAVIVCLAEPDRAMLADLGRLYAADPRPIVLFVGRDDPAFMEAAIAAGIASYHVVGAAAPDARPIVMAALAIFRKRRQLEAELAGAKRSLDEHRAVAAAKTLLMRRHEIGEPQAYRWLRRKAMNENKRIAAVATELLAAANGGAGLG